jgi:hypothetical protein
MAISREAQLLAKELLKHQREVRETMLISYKNLCERPGVPFNRESVGHYLCEIAERCKETGLPPLNALAVNKQKKKPGMGYDRTPSCSQDQWAGDLGRCLTTKYPARMIA